MNKEVQDVINRLIDRLREITSDEEQGFVSDHPWEKPVYVILLKEEGEYDELPDQHEMVFTPVDYIRKRRKDDSQFLAWAKVRTDEKDESKLDAAIWDTVAKAIAFCQLTNQVVGNVGYLMAIVASIDEIIKNVNPKLIPDLRALEAANNILIGRYLDEIYTRQKFMLNSVSGAVMAKYIPPLYMMPNSVPLSMAEAGNVDLYLKFMKVKGTRMNHILKDVVCQERTLKGERFGLFFLVDAITLTLIDANEKSDQKYRLEYTDWMNEYQDVYKHVFDGKADAYHPLIQILFNSHAIVDAIGKKRIFSTPGFKMLLDEAQEVLVYSKAHFEKAVDNNDDRYGDVIKDAWDKIAKIDYLKFDRTVNPSKNGIINDLECRLTVKKDDLDLSFHIHVNHKAYLLTYEHVKHELKVGDETAVDVIYLSLLKDFAAEYCREKPLEKALSKISDGLDIQLMDKLSSVLTVQFIDGGLLDVSDFIDDIGGLRYTYSLNYTVEGR